MPRYNPYIHSGQDLQCSTMQSHKTQNGEDSQQKTKWLSEKSIHITNFDYPSNSRWCTWKTNHNATILFVDIFNDEPNTTRLRPTKRNHRRHNDAIKKHGSKKPLSGWRHRLLRHCSRCSARIRVSPATVYHRPRVRAQNLYWFNDKQRFQAGKGKKQKIPCTNSYGRGLHRWYSVSGKRTRPSRNTAAWSRTRSCWRRSPCLRRQDGIHVLNQTGDISTLNGGSLTLVDKFIYLGSSVSSPDKDVSMPLAKTGYRSYVSQTWPIKWNAIFSKQRSCRYCNIDALHGR